MATYTQTGTTGNDSFTIASIIGSVSTPISGSIYRFDGLAGADTLMLSGSSGTYLDNFLRANFTIASADFSGMITISGASTGGAQYIFELTSVEQVVFADQTVTFSYPSTLTNSTLSFDVGIASPQLAATGQVTVKVANSSGGLTSVALNVSQLTLGGSHLIVPMTGTDANGTSYSLNAYSGSKLLVEIPAGLVVGQDAHAYAWQVGNSGGMGGTSYTITPMAVVVGGSGTAGSDWVTGTTGNDSINAGAGDDVIEWRGGNDTVDAGDGFDTVSLLLSGMTSNQFDAAGVLHIKAMSTTPVPVPTGAVDAYQISKQADASFRIDKMQADGTTVESTMVLSNAEQISVGYNNYKLQADTPTAGMMSLNGTSWNDQFSLNAATIGNLMSVSGNSGRDTLVLDVGTGYSKLEFVQNGTAYVLKGTAISDASVVELGRTAPGPNGTMMTLGTKSFTIYDIEVYRFVSDLVTLDFAPDTLSSNELSFDVGVTSPQLAATGQVTVKVASSSGGLMSVALNVSQLTLGGSHLIVPMTGTDANGTSYSLNAYSGSKLLVEIPAGLVVGQDAHAYAWQVGNSGGMGGTSYTITPMAVVVGGSGTAGSDWVTGTTGNDSINAGAGDDVIEWRGGNDMVDAGDAFDRLQLPMNSVSMYSQLDALSVLHIGTTWNGQLGTPAVDIYRMTNIAVDSYQVQQMSADGSTVESTFVLNNAEQIVFGSQQIRNLKLLSETGIFQPNSAVGSNLGGTPWDDQISLNASNLGSLNNVWGDSGHDTLVMDMGVGYSKLEFVHQGNAYLLKGTTDLTGVVADLGQVAATQPGNGLIITVGAKSFSANNIEAVCFVSGSAILEADATLFAEVMFSPGSTTNNIQGTLKDDIIDADALAIANGATVTHDNINGNSGHDSINAGTGNDTVWGGQGNDTLLGGLGDDMLYGDEGNDYMDGGAGNDTLYTGAWPEGSGHDTMLGGDGNDTLGAAIGNNFLYGGNGDDWVGGGTGNDWLEGGDGNDTCHGGSGNDSLYGGAGNDYLDGGDGNDYLEGGDGNDTVLGGQNGGSDTLYGNAGDDNINGIDGDDLLYGGDGNDTLYGEAGNDVMYGGAGNDSIMAGAGDNGNDTLFGEAGNDTLEGGSGDDLLTGGTGNDTLYGGSGNDTAVFSGNFADYLISYNSANSTYTVVDKVFGRDGVDVVNGVENFQFLDGTKAASASITPTPPSPAPIGFGKVTTDFGGGQDFGFSVAKQSDGKILMAGTSLNGGQFDFVLARFTVDGSLDTSFGAGQGKITTDFGYSDAGLSLAVQSDGKILVGGQSWDIGSNNSNFKSTLARYNSDGNLDTSFDGDGKVISSFACGQSLTVQSDGKILMVGTMDNATSSNIALLRYNIDGSLDTNFNGNGEVVTTIDSSGIGRSVALQPDGKILVAGSNGNNGNRDFAFARYNGDGTLDTSFHGGTMVTTDFGGDDQASDVVLQSDGKFLVVGYSLSGTNNIAIARYNTDGTLDTSFSGDGKIVEELGRDDQGYAVTVDPDGKILVSGHSDSNVVLLRYNADGTPDNTFSGDGLVTTNIGGVTLLNGQALTGTDVTLLAGGKILVSGHSNGDAALVRYNSDGSLDTTFGLSANTAPVFSDSHAGTVTTDFGGDDIGRSMTVQPDGKIIVAGLGNALGGFLSMPTIVSGTVTYNATNISYLIGDFALARYNADGTLDPTFNGDGTLTTYFGGNNLSPTGVVAQTDGKILVAGSGYNRNGNTIDFALVRYNSDGSLDTTFSGNGKVLTDFVSGVDTGNSIKMQSDGKILVAGASGTVTNGGTSNNNFALARYNADGSFDTSFDGDGKLTTDFGANEFGTGVTVQADGKILVAGYASTSFTYGYSATGTPLTTTNNNFALARYNADGSLDTTFDSDGKLTTDFGGNETGQSVIVQSDGKILVVGSSSLFFTGNNTLTTLNSDFALARYNADGTLDTTFHGDGKLTTDFGGSADSARSAILQSDGKILVAGNSTKTGGNADFALARYNEDGSLDTTFHGDGMFTMDFGGAADIIYSVSVQADGKILVGGVSTIDGNGDFALARLNTDGSLDTTFGASGVHQTLYTATGTPVLLDNSLQISDAELATIGNYAGATLTLMRHGGANVDDHFSAMAGQSLGALTQGADLEERGITVGSVTTNSGGTLALTFNASATPTLVNAVVQQIAYSNGSGTPPSSLQIDWSFSDGNIGSQGSGSALSATTSTTVQIAPFIAPPAAVTNTAPTFAGYATGQVLTDFGKDDGGRSIAVQSDGKILVAGLGNMISAYFTSGGTKVSFVPGDHAIARYNIDGSLDATFGDGGKLTTLCGGNADIATGVTLQSDGKILVAGTRYDRGGSNTNDFSLARYNSDGSLDASFAGNGKVLTDFSAHNDLGQSIFLQADGRILVAGTSGTVTGVTPSTSDVALVRYNADGSLDTTFGGNGKITIDFGGTDNGTSVAVQSDGKIIVVGSSSVVLNGISKIDFVFARYNADGSLESKETIDFAGNNIARSVAVQSDGKFLVVGDSTLSGHTDFRIARSNTAGNDLYAAFGINGAITTDFGGNDYARSVILQSDGKILVAGNSTPLATGVSDFALARYNTDGTLDTTFDGDGKLTMDFGGASDTAYSVKLQADGKILVAGSSAIDGSGDFALARLNTDGSLDTTFGVVNTLNGHPVSVENGTPVVLDSDVRVSDTELVAVGNYAGATLTLTRHGGASADDNFSAIASGTLSALAQGGDLVAGGVAVGTVTTNSGGTLSVAFNASATPDLVNAVLQHIAYSNTSHVEADTVQIDWTFSDGNTGSQGTGGALSAVGSTTVHVTGPSVAPPDPSVNTAPTFAVGDGTVITDFGKEDIGRSVAVQADGKILVAGLGNGISGYINASAGNMSYTIGDFGLARYNIDGSLDTTFGTDGKLTTYFGGNSDYATGVTVQSDSKILVAGTGYNRGTNDFALACYNADGTLDTTFSANGKVTTDFASTNDTLSGIKMQSDGKILVVGTSGTVPGVTPSNNDFAIARYNADGSLDTTFDGDGKLITDFGGSDSATGVSVMADGTFIVAGTSNVGLNGVVSNQNFAFAGYNADGTLIGKTTLDFGGYDYCQSVTVLSDGKWILSGYSGVLVNGVLTNYNFALARYNADVTLDTTFDGDGMLTTDFGGNDYIRSVTVQSDGKILVAGNSTLTNGTSDFALARYNSNGTLDTTFDKDGKLTMDFGGAADTAYSVTLQADGKILVAGSSSIDGNGNFALARLNTDGSLDHTFGMVNNTLDARQVYSENGTPVVLDSNVHVSDTQLAALGNYSGATLTLLRHGAANAEDHFSGAGTLGTLTQGGNLVVGGTTVGTVTTNSGGTLDLAFNASATQNLVNTVMQQIAYSNTSHVTGVPVQLDWSFADGNNGTQGTGGALSTTGSTVVQILPDTTAPKVINFSPADATFGVAVGNNIILTFSEAIQSGTGLIEIHSGSATGAIVASFDAATSPNLIIAGNTLTINPTADLVDGIHYVVTISPGSIEDLAGNDYAGTADYDFTAGVMTINYNGVPTRTAGSYESFGDFFLDTTKQTLPGYLASFVTNPATNGTAYMSDGNGDGIPDSFTENWTNPSNNAQMTTSGTIALDAAGVIVFHVTAGATTSNYDHWGRIAFDAQWNAVGMYMLNINPVFTLTPDAVLADALIASFTIPSEPGTWSLLDNDLNGVIDTMTQVQSQTKTTTYLLTWSNSTHWTAHTIMHLGFGSTFDSQNRPTIIPYYTSGATAQSSDVRNDIPIVWQSRDADNVIATFSFTSSTNTASGKFFDTNSDNIPDQISFTETGNGITYTTTAKLIGWSNLSSTNPDAVTGEILTSTNPDDMFSGTVKGNSRNPTTLEMASYFMGSSGNNGTDTTPPTITAFRPADGVTGVAVGSNIVLTFSEAIQKGTGVIAIHSGSATGAVVESYDVATSTNLTITGNTLTINPTADLASGTHYFVTFGNGNVTDLAGNPSTGTNTYDFTTEALPLHQNLTGSATFWKTDAPIAGVTSALTTGIASDTITTGADGLYQHLNMPDGTYALTSAKVSGTAESNAIHANDALAALKMAVGMNPNTDGSAVLPWQFLAADVNKDGVIRATDALNILKMAVKFSTAPEKEWLFVPDSVGSEAMSRTHVVWPDNPIPVSLDVDQDLHLIGIVKGDVDGSWVA
ncbi:MAG: Ig-like domain-containing protein [Chlorobium sp.]